MRAATQAFAGAAIAAVLVVAGVAAPASVYKNDAWNSAVTGTWRIASTLTLAHGQSSTVAYSDMRGYRIGIQVKEVIRGVTIISARNTGLSYVSRQGDRINQHRSSF